MDSKDFNRNSKIEQLNKKDQEAITAFRVDRKLTKDELQVIDDVEGVDFAHYIEMAV